MNKTIAAFVCLVSLSTIAMTARLAGAEPLTVQPGDTIEKLLVAQKGKVVTVRFGCEAELTGKVASVTSEVVQLSELVGKEFYDGVVSMSDIKAIIVRTH